MFAELETSFLNLDSSAQLFWRNITQANRKNVRDAIQSFQQSLLRNADVCEGFLSCYGCKLLALHLLFNDRSLRGDAIRVDMTTLFQKFHIDTSSSITKLFNEFIKGITYFHDQVNFMVTNKPVPLYHRTTCCGPREGPIINVERCYVERKLYDEIYKLFVVHFPKTMDDHDYFEPQQDDGHVQFLNVMKQLYAATFPDVQDISVTINKDVEFHLPLTITITKQYKDGKITEDIYAKTYKVNKLNNQLYENDVKCSRKDTSGGTVKFYEKKQSFEQEITWKEVVAGGNKKKPSKNNKTTT